MLENSRFEQLGDPAGHCDSSCANKKVDFFGKKNSELAKKKSLKRGPQKMKVHHVSKRSG